jgi:hypothetical protein
MANKLQGKRVAADLAESLIAGIQKRLASVTQVPLAGGAFTPTQIVDELQKLVSMRADVEAARTATAAKVATEQASSPAIRAFMDTVVAYVRAAFGNQADVLADFGLTPKKARTPLTVEQKAAAAAKREATRAARGTKSAKAKKGIKGTVTGVEITPVVAQPTKPAAQAPAAPTAAPHTGTAPGGSTPITT